MVPDADADAHADGLDLKLDAHDTACREPCVAIVTCGEVHLKLTLSDKLLSTKSFSKAVVAPFLKVFNKRTHQQSLTPESLDGVTVDGTERPLAATLEELAGRVLTGDTHKVELLRPKAAVPAPPSDDDAVDRVLAAKHEFEALQIPVEGEPASGGDVRTAFRAASLAVHPDEVSHPRAAEAFRKAFDAMKLLIDPARQAARRRQILQGDEADGSSLVREMRWWTAASVPEMEQAFRILEEFMDARDAFGEAEIEHNLWVAPRDAARLRHPVAYFVDARDEAAFGVSHVKGALSLPGHTMEQLGEGDMRTVLALARSPASMIVVYSDDGSKLSCCAHVSRILRTVTQPERVRRLSGGLNEWKREGLPCDGDPQPTCAPDRP